MKRVKVLFIVLDEVSKERIKEQIASWHAEIEHYEEKHVPKESNILTEHSFDELKDAAFDFINGIWTAMKAFVKMTGYALIVVVEAIKWLWNKGLGSKDE